MSGGTDDRHEVHRDELAAYALGGLEPAEAARVEGHLAGCERCSEYLRWLDPAVDMLPASVEQLRAPRRLKRAVMGEVRDDLKAERRAKGRSAGAGRTPGASWWRPITAVAAGLALVAGIAGGYVLGDQDEPDRVLVEAQPLLPAAGARMAATLEREGERAILHVERLPALEQDRVYQAWIERDGVMEPSTVFVVDRGGRTDVVIEGDLEGSGGVYITREPRGGSDEPTPPVLMKAPLT